jgi:pilus assembly protein TadC
VTLDLAPLDLAPLSLTWPSPWAWAASACAALAVLALVPRPRGLGALSSPRRTGRPSSSGWWRGRSDAVPLGRRAIVGSALAAVLVVLGLRTDVPAPVGLAVGLLLGTAAVLVLGRLEPASVRRRRQVLVLQTPQALELMASCLAAGLPVRGACAVVVDAFDGPVAEDLGLVRAATDLGVADADAWAQLSGHPQLGPAASDLARSVESGTLLVTTLRHHAARARERRQAALQVAARSVGVRSVLPLMTCFIPAFLLLGVVPTVASALACALSF